MTTYTFVPIETFEAAPGGGVVPVYSGGDWSNPSIWSSGVVPNGPDADVVIPATAVSGFPVTLGLSSAYTIHSLSMEGNDLTIDNIASLTVAGSFGVAGGEIDLESGSAETGYASLSAGSLTNDGWIQGQGTITSSGAFLNEAGGTIVGEGLSITAGSFDNAGLLESASGDLTITTKPGGFSNLSGSTLTGGAYGDPGNSGRVLYLNVGAVITTDAASIALYPNGEIETYDSAKSAYQPIEATMQDIASTGTLTLMPGLADSWGNLAVGGLLLLGGADPTTSQLTVDAGGKVVGTGSISGPVVDDGTITAGLLPSSFTQGNEFSSGTGMMLDITGAISGSGTLTFAPTISGSSPWTLELGSAASVNVAFADAHGVLVLGDPSAFTGNTTLAGAGDQIQLPGIALSSVTGYSYAAGQNGGVLTLDLNSGSKIDLRFAGSAVPGFALSDPSGLMITYNGSATPAPDLLRDHFDGASVSDILIENTAGSIVVGQIADGMETYTQVASLGPEWTFEGTGDLLGDGKSDFLIENTNGAVDVGKVSNGSTTYTEVSALGPEWRFEGAGDFFGPSEGYSSFTATDLGGAQDQFLIENTAGALALGTVFNGQTDYSAIGGLGPEWKIVGTGAYLGDGQRQFLIENANGGVDVGEVTAGISSVRYTQVAALGPEWKFVESGDFLDDGKSQFLIENTAGALAIGEVGSNNAAHYTAISGLGSELKFVGAGDYLEKGYDQFAIENTSGAVFIGDYTGGQVRFTHVGALGPEWSFHG